MKLFSILRSKSIHPTWEYRARGVIWRLLPADEGLFVGEDRDHEKRTVSFFCLDEHSGKPLWNNRQFGEQWWISVETVHRNVVFLHEFVRPDFPDHQKIIAVDISTGTVLWRNEEYKFLFAHQDCVYAMKELFETIAVCELDLRTGEILRDLKDQPDYVKVLRDTAESQKTPSIHYPEPFTERTYEHGRVISSLIDINRLRGEIEIIETTRHLIFGFYQNASRNPLEQELDQHLKIIEKENGEIVFSDVIMQKGKMPVPDMFFVHGSLLFYVKNQNTLRAISLAQ